MATLIWGTLDATAARGLPSRLPEACRLSDALVGRCGSDWGWTCPARRPPTGSPTCAPQLERIRDQVGLEPAGATQQNAAAEQSRLARRLKESPRRQLAAATSVAARPRSRSTPPASSGT